MIAPVAQIFLYAIGSAIFPALLAGVSVILTRERPAPMLLAFYIGGMIVSISAGLFILKAIGPEAAKLGTSKDKVSPAVGIIGGILAFAFAWLLASKRGRALIERALAKHEAKHPKKEKTGSPWTVRVLDRGSVTLAFIAGAVLNLPGPFYLISLGNMAIAHYSTAEQISLVVVFNLIMFVLAEAPLIGYMVNPEKTEQKVKEFSDWLKRNGLRIVAAVCVLWGLSEIAKSVQVLAG